MHAQLDRVCSGVDLDADETAELFGRVVTGELEAAQVAALLVALKSKGESPAEIAGAASALRRHARGFHGVDGDFADTCGTGGDGAGTVNISTAVALVAAEMGIPIAKHGNRSVSSKCGSADVLETLGVKLDMPTRRAERCLRDVGVTYLHAPHYHAGVRFAMPVRRSLKTRTIFNLLGPLVNPAKPPVQLVGVYDPDLCGVLAETLAMLGVRRALVVHGSGLDEVAVHGPTCCVRVLDGAIQELTVVPDDAGIDRHRLDALRGGSPAHNAGRLRSLLAGEPDPAYRDAVALNTAALAHLFRGQSLPDAAAEARDVIGLGRALDRLHAFAEVSRGS